MSDETKPLNEQLEKGGYRPLQEGYAPGRRGYVPNASGNALPKAPQGGTGQTSPAQTGTTKQPGTTNE